MKLSRRVLKTKIGRRLLIVFLGISLLPLAVLGWIAIRRAEAEIHTQTLHVLQAATDGAEAQLREFLEHLKSRTVGLSLDGVLRDNLQTVTSERASTASIAQAAAELQTSLVQRAERFPDRQEMFLMNLEGRTVSSSQTGRVGLDYGNSDFFRKGRDSVFVSDVFRDPLTGKITWIIAAPVHGRSSGKLIGVLAERIDPSQLTDLTTGRRVTRMGADTQSFRIGETGETYIVNRDKLMITESRFVSNAVLNVKVDTQPVRRGLSEGRELRGDYQDYRGRQVSGASTLIPETGWVMLTEIDFTQAFAPLKRLQRALLPVTAALILPVGFLAWRFTRKIVRPLEQLNKAEAALIENHDTHGPDIFVPDEHIPSDEIGDAIRRRNQRVQTLLQQQQQLSAEQQHRAELLGKMLREALTFSRTLFWRMPLPSPANSFAETCSHAEIYGSVEELLGFPIIAFRKNPRLLHDHMNPDDFRTIQQLLTQLNSEGSAVRHVCRFRHSKGQWISLHLQVSVVRSENDHHKILHGIGTDVTDLMQAQTELQAAQDQLRNYAASLEREVGERTAKLQETVRSLEGVCYHLVHDLRAPLRAMQGFTSLLLQEYGPRFDPRGQNYAHRICDSAARMDRLITDLLEFGNIGHMPLRPSTVSLADVIDSARTDLQKTIRASHAQLIIDAPLPSVLANPSALHKVFTHLLSNALTFTLPGSTPRIRIWAEQKEDIVRIFLQDNGIGIPEEYRDRIFGIFERLHTDQSYPGTGIGLAIVSKAIQRMGGKVGFESLPGKGTTFWLELPRAD